MKKLLMLVVIGTFVAACATLDEGPPPGDTTTVSDGGAPRATETPVTPTDPNPAVDFLDLKRFDKTLSSSLRHHPPEVTVQFRAPANVNDMPPRLHKWLSMVEKYQGKVDIQEDPDYQTRGIPGVFSIVVGAFVAMYKAIENKLLYGPVEEYDATVFYHREKGTITRVVFTRREPNS